MPRIVVEFALARLDEYALRIARLAVVAQDGVVILAGNEQVALGADDALVGMFQSGRRRPRCSILPVKS